MVQNDRAAYLPAQVESVHAGHHQIGQDQVRHILCGLFQPLLPVAGIEQPVTVFEQPSDVERNILIVLHEQDGGGVRTRRPALGRSRIGGRDGWGKILLGFTRDPLLPLRSPVLQGQRNEEDRTFADRTFDRNLSAHRLHHLFGQRQPDSCPHVHTGIVPLVERLENMGQILFVDTLPRIGDLNNQVVVFLCGRNIDMSTLRRIFQGIGQEVMNYFPKILRDEIGLKKGLLRHENQIEVLLLGKYLEVFHDHPNKGHDVSRPPVRFFNRGTDLGDVQQLIDQTQKMVALADNGLQRGGRLLVCPRFFGQLVGKPENNRQRRAEFMGDIREKLAADSLHVAHDLLRPGFYAHDI